jgi:hypothetical protein
MKNPLTEWNHWLVWIILSLTVSGATYIITGQIASIFVFFTWLISIAFVDTLMHYAGWQ